MSFKVPIYYGTGDDNENVVTYDNDTSYSGLPVPVKITPSGTLEISANGEYDVTEYAGVDVSVAGGGTTPTGTKEISITQNGTTTEDVTDYASAEITANVPNTYTQSDEGKVVSSGVLVAQGSDTVTQNGTVDTTLISSLLVNVAGASVYKLTHIEITPVSNATGQNKINVQLPISNSYIISVLSEELPPADAELYWVLNWTKAYYNGGDTAKTYSAMLRPNGSIGTDMNMCTYNPSTGNLALGGTYGSFKAGVKYHIYFIDTALS